MENGTQGWMYDQMANSATLFNPKAMIGDAGPSAAFGAVDLRALLKNAGRDYSVELLGTEQVAGRSAYVLKLTPRPNSPKANWMAHARTWIDQETFLQLRSEWYNAQGQVITEWAYSRLELNPQLGDELFTFTPPPGKETIWQRSASSAEQEQHWRQIAQQASAEASLQIYKPTYVPDGLTREAPR